MKSTKSLGAIYWVLSFAIVTTSLLWSYDCQAQSKSKRSVRRIVREHKQSLKIDKKAQLAFLHEYDSIQQKLTVVNADEYPDSLRAAMEIRLVYLISKIDWKLAEPHIDTLERLIYHDKIDMSKERCFDFLLKITWYAADHANDTDYTIQKFKNAMSYGIENNISTYEKALLVFVADDRILNYNRELKAHRLALLDSTIGQFASGVHPNLYFRLLTRHADAKDHLLTKYERLANYENILDYGLAHTDSIHANILGLHCYNTASAYLAINEDNRALKLFDLGIHQVNQLSSDTETKINLSYLLSRKIECLLKLERHSEAIAISDTALNLAYSIDPLQVQLLKYLYRDKYMTLESLNDEQALNECLDSVIKYSEINLINDQLKNTFTTYSDIGKRYYNLNQFDKAQYFIEKAFRNNEEKKQPYWHAMLGTTYIRNNNLSAAINVLNERKLLSRGQYASSEFQDLNHFIDLAFLLQKHTGDSIYVNDLNDIVDHIFDDRLEDYIQLANYELNQEHIFVIYELFEKLLAIHSELGILSHARLFQIHNNAKGLDLWKDQFNHANWSIDRLPGQVLDRYQEFVDRRDKLNASLQSFGASMTDSVNALRLQVFQVDDSLRMLQEAHNPTSVPFTSLIMDSELPSTVDDSLKQDECIVSYWMGEKYLHVLMQSKNSFFEYSTSADSVNKYADLFANAIRDRNVDYRPFARSLYTLLFQPIDEHIRGSVTQLAIFPDHVLHTIPFDVLIDESDRHLIEKYSISIESSIKQYLIRNQHDKAPLEADLIAFAPDYQDDDLAKLDQHAIALLTRSGPYHLPGAQLEADQIASAWRGRSIVGKAANKSNFSNLATSGSIMHLAMHAVLDESNHDKSYLHFSTDSIDGQLTSRDIQKLKINAPFITLSACNTGVGKTQQGTGARSIARGFLSTGVPSLLMSLWRVPDESTSEIMINFYEHLATGTPKHLALQQAKLDYIKDVQDPQLAHPYYWAGFTLYGDTQAVVPKPYFNPVLIGIVTGLLGLLAFGLLRRKAR